MQVILLERVAKLGQMGDVVRVKDGFARNYLLPKGKALRATKENRARFETMKVELEARNLEQKGEAEKIAQKLDGQSFAVLRQAAEGADRGLQMPQEPGGHGFAPWSAPRSLRGSSSFSPVVGAPDATTRPPSSRTRRTGKCSSR